MTRAAYTDNLTRSHQPHSAESALAQRAQEAAPEHFVFAVADIDAEDLTGAVCGDPGGHDDGHRAHLRGRVPHVQIGGIEIHVGELDVIEPTSAEGTRRRRRRARQAQIRDTSLLEIPESTPNAATRSSTERVDTPLT
jgi:hypothetical protein